MTASINKAAVTEAARTSPVTKPKKGNRRFIPIPVDEAWAQEDARLRAKFAKTTPHGRELIRKRLYALKKRLLADVKQISLSRLAPTSPHEWAKRWTNVYTVQTEGVGVQASVQKVVRPALGSSK